MWEKLPLVTEGTKSENMRTKESKRSFFFSQTPATICWDWSLLQWISILNSNYWSIIQWIHLQLSPLEHRWESVCGWLLLLWSWGESSLTQRPSPTLYTARAKLQFNIMFFTISAVKEREVTWVEGLKMEHDPPTSAELLQTAKSQI